MSVDFNDRRCGSYLLSQCVDVTGCLRDCLEQPRSRQTHENAPGAPIRDPALLPDVSRAVVGVYLAQVLRSRRFRHSFRRFCRYGVNGELATMYAALWITRPRGCG